MGILGAALALALTLASCSGGDSSAGIGRGMETDNPSDVLSEVIDRYTAGDDYMSLFGSDVDESATKVAVAQWQEDGGRIFAVIQSGAEVFETLTGDKPKVGKGETLLGFYVGTEQGFEEIKGHGYALVSEGDPGKYYVAEFGYGTL
jgi:hypothetical protein